MRPSPRKKKCKKAKWLSEEALQIAVERREAKATAFARHLTGEDSLLMSGEGSADPVLQALTQQSQGGIIVPAGDNFWTPMSRLLGKLSSEAGEEPDWAALLAECADAMNK